jgi:hypothetical protein
MMNWHDPRHDVADPGERSGGSLLQSPVLQHLSDASNLLKEVDASRASLSALCKDERRWEARALPALVRETK